MGLIPDYDRRAGFGGLKPGDRLLLVGETRGELGASLYLRELFGREDGAPPPVDLAAEKKQRRLRARPDPLGRGRAWCTTCRTAG